MNQYLTAENVRLALSGLAGGAGTGVLWALRRQSSIGPVGVAVAVAVAFVLGRPWWRIADWSTPVLIAATATLLAVLGAVDAAKQPRVGWLPTSFAVLVSALAVWLAVPETAPIVMGIAVTAGLIGSAIATSASLSPWAIASLTALVGAAGIAGAVGRTSATIGAALCLGLLLWFTFRRRLPWRGLLPPGPWLLLAHGVLALATARRIAIAPNLDEASVALVVGCGLAVTAISRRWA